MTTPRPVHDEVILTFLGGIQDGVAFAAPWPPDVIPMPTEFIAATYEARQSWACQVQAGELMNVYIVELPPERVMGLEADTLRFKYRLSGQIDAQEITTEDKL